MAGKKISEEKLMQMQIISQQLQEFQKYLQNIDKQLIELKQVIGSIDEFKSVKVNDEMLGPIANGIFVKSTVADNKTFLVNVGNNVIVEKSIDQTKELLNKQLVELESYRIETINEFNNLAVKLESMQKELQ